MSDTGTAISGISVARQFCRKMKTTRITSAIASTSVIEISLNALGDRQRRVERDDVIHVIGEALLQLAPSSSCTAFGDGSAFEPGA